MMNRVMNLVLAGLASLACSCTAGGPHSLLGSMQKSMHWMTVDEIQAVYKPNAPFGPYDDRISQLPGVDSATLAVVENEDPPKTPMKGIGVRRAYRSFREFVVTSADVAPSDNKIATAAPSMADRKRFMRIADVGILDDGRIDLSRCITRPIGSAFSQRIELTVLGGVEGTNQLGMAIRAVGTEHSLDVHLAPVRQFEYAVWAQPGWINLAGEVASGPPEAQWIFDNTFYWLDGQSRIRQTDQDWNSISLTCKHQPFTVPWEVEVEFDGANSEPVRGSGRAEIAVDIPTGSALRNDDCIGHAWSLIEAAAAGIASYDDSHPLLKIPELQRILAASCIRSASGRARAFTESRTATSKWLADTASEWCGFGAQSRKIQSEWQPFSYYTVDGQEVAKRAAKLVATCDDGWLPRAIQVDKVHAEFLGAVQEGLSGELRLLAQRLANEQLEAACEESLDTRSAESLLLGGFSPSSARELARLKPGATDKLIESIRSRAVRNAMLEQLDVSVVRVSILDKVSMAPIVGAELRRELSETNRAAIAKSESKLRALGAPPELVREASLEVEESVMHQSVSDREGVCAAIMLGKEQPEYLVRSRGYKFLGAGTSISTSIVAQVRPLVPKGVSEVLLMVQADSQDSPVRVPLE